MARGKSTKSSKDRNRFLNVIYFIDASKTRSFQLPVVRVKWMLGCVSLLLIWSFSSAYLSYDTFAEKEILKEAGKIKISSDQLEYGCVVNRRGSSTGVFTSGKKVKSPRGWPFLRRPVVLNFIT